MVGTSLLTAVPMKKFRLSTRTSVVAPPRTMLYSSAESPTLPVAAPTSAPSLVNTAETPHLPK